MTCRKRHQSRTAADTFRGHQTPPASWFLASGGYGIPAGDYLPSKREHTTSYHAGVCRKRANAPHSHPFRLVPIMPFSRALGQPTSPRNLPIPPMPCPLAGNSSIADRRSLLGRLPSAKQTPALITHHSRGGALRPTIVLVFVGMVLGSRAQAQTVVGRLLDRETREPLSAVEITLTTLDSVSVRRTITNPNGNFSLSAAAGTYRLNAQRLGYAGATIDSVVVTGTERLVLELQMSAEAVELEGVAVTVDNWWRPGQLGGFYDRRREGKWGTFVTKADFGPYANRMSDILNQFLNVSCAIVFLDGRPLKLFDGETLDSRVFPNELDAIEVYRGGGVPSRYTTVDVKSFRCPTVLLWTPYALDDPLIRMRNRLR